MKKLSFRSQFVITLILTLTLSIVCTLVVWGLSLYFVSTEADRLRPANYYEQQIPDIIAFANEHQDQLFSTDFQEPFEQVLPLEGMDYQIVHSSGEFLYGSMDEIEFSGPDDVITKINTSEQRNNQFVTYRPIVNHHEGFRGLVILQYPLNLVSSNPAQVSPIVLFIVVNFAAPFFFVLLFTLLFARFAGRRLEPPVSRLIDGAKRIERQELDFVLVEDGGSQEITQLAASFEKMRSALHTSLQTQWQMEEERRDMVAAIAHDLRTPLTIVQGHVDNLLENKAKRAERLDDYLQTIRKSCERAVRLLNEMSIVSEIDQPEFQLKLERTDVLSFSKEKLAEYKLLCEEHHLSFESDLIQNRHSPSMIVDCHRLEQMMDNVINNSLRFTPSGGTIYCRITLKQEEVLFEIEDTGPGFADEDIPFLFQKFYQGDLSRSRNKGHAGLGFYMVKVLAEKHGGEVSARNRAAGGAKIAITVKSNTP